MSERRAQVPAESATVSERSRTRRRVNKGIAVAGGIALAGGALYGGYVVHILGVSPKTRTEAVMKDRAAQNFMKDFQASSAAGKFAMQFLSITTYEVNSKYGGKGLFGYFSAGDGQPTSYDFGDACLSLSAYDISPVESTVGRGRVVTAAQAGAVQSETNPDQLTIISAGNVLPQLVFNGVNGTHLTAANSSTASQLATYGCSATIDITGTY